MNRIGAALPLLLGFTCFVAGCRAEQSQPAITSSYDTVLVVLGNEPLDDQTPTVDMVERVKGAVAFHNEHPNSLLVFTGGKTAGSISEARMMVDLAVAQGISTNSFLLEEKSRTTEENAEFVSELLHTVNVDRLFIVSKTSHLEWAMPIFKKYDFFANAEPLSCNVSREASIAQMEAYLKHNDSRRVRQRLQWLKEQVRGTD